MRIQYHSCRVAPMPLDPSRTVAELRELQELTGDENGAQRVAWTDTWERAREWLRGKVDGTGAEEEIDAAGNQWFTLRGGSEQALLLGGHIDSVPNGGWLDGSLNVMAGVEVLRRIADDGAPPSTVRLVNWADEEGARFGRSLFGSSAAAGSMADQDELRTRRDANGIALPDALAEHGVDLDRALNARAQLENAAAYLELHIEQGPVLESLDLPLGVVLGTFGVERSRVTWRGQAAHAGSTPMDKRRDALAGAAKLALYIREIAAQVGAPVATRPAARRRRSLPRGHPDGDAVRAEPARPLAHEAGRHEARASGTERASARQARVEDDRLADPNLIRPRANQIRVLLGGRGGLNRMNLVRLRPNQVQSNVKRQRPD